MDKLHRDELILLALRLDLSDILRFSRVSKYLEKIIYNNENFWRQKIEYEHPGLTRYLNSKEKSFREIYRILDGSYNNHYSIKLREERGEKKEENFGIVAVVKGIIDTNGFKYFYASPSFKVGDNVWVATMRYHCIITQTKQTALFLQKQMPRPNTIQEIIIL